MIERKTIIERSHQAFHTARTLTYLGELKLLQNFTKLFRPWVEVPTEPEKDVGARPFILKDIENLYREDGELFSQGPLPLQLLTPESPLKHGTRLARILWTSVKMSRLRKTRRSKPEAPVEEDLPDYFVRNFHWQIDGYLSEESAAIYDHQVEILFTGTAQAMRRLALPPLIRHVQTLGRKAQILELACGTGELSATVRAALPDHQLTITDLSAPYLALAQKRLMGLDVDFLRTSADALPLKDASQDVVYNVFLMHELPTKVRRKVIAEAMRVLRPGGVFITVDSIQEGEVPEYAWALKKFPQDYHEPFYKSYVAWPMEKAFIEAGLLNVQSKRGFFSKCVWGTRPS
jgi:ubiquinone/menaquinone biosynthesis C-methylase UbiE